MPIDNEKLTTVVDFSLLSKLVVGISEVAKITGIPTRKIRYWEEKGPSFQRTKKGQPAAMII